MKQHNGASFTKLDTVRCRYNAVSCLPNIHKTHLQFSRWGDVWDVFVDPASDWYSASVSVVIYVITYNSGQRYNDIQLHS